MRTNIELDDDLVDQAMALSGLTTKRAVVDHALRFYVRAAHWTDPRNLRGKIRFADGYDFRTLRSPSPTVTQ
jgi:Arc/MetJ family transcription regulator